MSVQGRAPNATTNLKILGCTVALAYSVQVTEDPVPVDATDVPVDALVLSTGVLPISDYGIKSLSNSAA